MTDNTQNLTFGLAISLALGIAFETPVAIVLLIYTGFVTPKQLRDNRGYVLVGCFVIAAVLTPPDVVSQFLLAVPTYLLFELGVIAGQWMSPGTRDVEEQQAIVERK